MSLRSAPVFGAVLLFACSSSSSATAPSDAGSTDASAPPPVDASAIDAYQGAVTEHGTLFDYFSLQPVAGLIVTDNGVTTTTDADGKWSLTLPPGAVLQPSITGPSYATVIFPEALPAAADVDHGPNLMPTSSAYQLELSGLSSNPSKALVQVVVLTAPTCPSAVGGTLRVVSPAGAEVQYFATTGLPDDSLTSFQDVKPYHPVAVVFNIPVGADLQVELSHPTCKATALPFTYLGKTFTGKAATKPSEPNDVSAALELMLE